MNKRQLENAILEMSKSMKKNQFISLNDDDYKKCFFNFCKEHNLDAEIGETPDSVSFFGYDENDTAYGGLYSGLSFAEMCYNAMVNISVALMNKQGANMSEFAEVVKINGKYYCQYPNGDKVLCINEDAANQRKHVYDTEVLKGLKIGGYEG